MNLDFHTYGKKIFEGYALPMKFWNKDVFSDGLKQRDYYKLILIYSGTAFVLINDIRQIIVAPSILCMNESDKYYLELGTSVEAIAIAFHPQIINQNFDFDVLKKETYQTVNNNIQDAYWLNSFRWREEKCTGQLYLRPDNAKIIQFVMEKINESLEMQMHDWPCRSRTYLIELLFMLSRIPIIDEVFKHIEFYKDPAEIKEIILFIYTNYMNKIKMQDLTDKFHINRTSLTERFKAVTGYPIMEYIIRVRIYVASQMLRETLLPISEILNRVGFSDATHFSRMFKKHMGCAPSEYRSANCVML
ncbi:AraC family transcriptional regulator [Paludicola sp. MB14-C6]|uniref:AraC family transcriptional regulator n=1 Tax=Paludihabitans sp. MB14-C6 TaxID=3070656 RepID=UPI0027DD930C|nr:helix-turn-helix domain-containing protein [Paludicola sp. MB14-C6]WMJ23561.1 AraC family transcriptional regulator [Paludicola sp. MB14-C6]